MNYKCHSNVLMGDVIHFSREQTCAPAISNACDLHKNSLSSIGSDPPETANIATS